MEPTSVSLLRILPACLTEPLPPGWDLPAPGYLTEVMPAVERPEVVTLSLAKCLGTAGYGRIEFAFNVVFWLVLLVRDGLEVIAAREIARHPRLIRPLVDAGVMPRITR